MSPAPWAAASIFRGACSVVQENIWNDCVVEKHAVVFFSGGLNASAENVRMGLSQAEVMRIGPMQIIFSFDFTHAFTKPKNEKTLFSISESPFASVHLSGLLRFSPSFFSVMPGKH